MRLANPIKAAMSWAFVGALLTSPSSASPKFESRPSAREPIRLLYDEAHHNAHTSEDKYRSLVERMRTADIEVRINRNPFTEEELENVDVLLIPVARSAGREKPLLERFAPAFTNAEVDALFQWVSGGGGLLLFTDHRPSAGAVESLSNRFGIEMSNGFTADKAQGHSEDDRGWSRHGFHLVFSRGDGTLAEHPITTGRSSDEQIRSVKTLLGQSLSGPPGSISILKLGPTAVDWYLRWSEGIWEAPVPGRDEMKSAAGRSQALALEVGTGRAVFMGEAGLFTLAGLGPWAGGDSGDGFGNAEFALNIVRWLAGHL